MAEISFPVVNHPLNEDQWKGIALALPQGILDRGGWPYWLKARDSVNNTVTIGVDQITNRNEAILQGFMHRVDHDVVINVPAVTVETTYQIGLVYDPAWHGTTGGPVRLQAWTKPGDYDEGRARLVLYEIDRAPNVSLGVSPYREYRQRIAPVMAVTDPSHLPKVETMLTDTLAFVRSTAEWYRVSNNGTDPASWIRVTSGDLVTTSMLESHVNARLGGYGNATPFETGSRVMARFPDGTARVRPPKEHWDIVNLGTLQEHIGTRAPSSHNHSASDITSGTLNRNRVDGSMSAYNNIQSGTHYTVSVNSSGFFARYSSTERDKTNIRSWTPDPRVLLAVDTYVYDRIDRETGRVTLEGEVGTVVERAIEAGVTEFAEIGPDKIDEDGKPLTEDRPQGWDYAKWTTAHQFLLRWLTERVDTQDREIEALKNELRELKGE